MSLRSSNEKKYFDKLASNSALIDSGNNLKSLISAYEDYLKISDYCGENKSSKHFQELRESVKIVLNKLIDEKGIPSADIEATKDKAFNQAVSKLENDNEHQQQLRMINSLDESQSYNFCKQMVEGIAPAYRMMAKEATKSTEKKKRDL